MNTEKTVPELITNRIKKYGNKILFQHKDGWSWKQVTWLDYENSIKDAASFLLGLGFNPGNAVLMISGNRMESIWAESGVYLLGGVLIPVSEDESVERILQIARDAEPKFIFTGSETTLEKVRKVTGQIPSLEKVISFSDFKVGDDEKVVPFKAVLKFGAINRKKLGEKLAEVTKGVLPDSPAAVFYDFNSGGELRRKEIAHRVLVKTIRVSSEKLSFIGEEDQVYFHLPSVSSFERLVNYLSIYMGTRIVVAETREDFFEDILEVKPSVVFETKTGLEDICKVILCDFQKSSPIQKLRGSLGGRIKYVITDSLPERREVRNLFSKSEILLIEIPELVSLFV